ncbi:MULTISPECIES: hypothetical protein [Streptomyces]|uniref:Lipoprotein n=1 Tax=Streptomyces albidocamelliae TaxID=2981135 RepID=A0ABY6EX35_9ACTN|nr:hypothetical protein [Streptomyces sp. HUAS 14-6]UXY38871.1 hypothetical protein N8I86_31615 [Streptomyces sp. HUAS 14-6]
MNRRRIAVAALALLALSGCSSEKADKAEAKPTASRADGARQAVDSYISALNARSATDLIRIGGVKDEAWSRREAAKILAAKGGRGWKVSNLDIEHDMGPNTGSAHLSATDRAGKAMTDTFTVTRDKGTWHLMVFSGQPHPPGKTPASTAQPTSSS